MREPVRVAELWDALKARLNTDRMRRLLHGLSTAAPAPAVNLSGI
jgi:hypothetical protein